jgi:poly(3-hydroxybutyrate) depolymerase
MARYLDRMLVLAMALTTSVAVAAPQTVYFMSGDGNTEIVAYLYEPSGPSPHPAMVMLHGRAGQCYGSPSQPFCFSL